MNNPEFSTPIIGSNWVEIGTGPWTMQKRAFLPILGFAQSPENTDQDCSQSWTIDPYDDYIWSQNFCDGEPVGMWTDPNRVFSWSLFGKTGKSQSIVTTRIRSMGKVMSAQVFVSQEVGSLPSHGIVGR